MLFSVLHFCVIKINLKSICALKLRGFAHLLLVRPVTVRYTTDRVWSLNFVCVT